MLTVTSDKHITVVIADDHPIFRKGLSNFVNTQPGLKLLDVAANGRELVNIVSKHKPNVVLTDIKMPEMDGIEATSVITKNNPCTGVIALTMFGEDHYVMAMLQAGAKGYLLKDANEDVIIRAIKKISQNGVYYCASTSKNSCYHSPLDLRNKAFFNNKELAIIKLICEQHCNKEIADKLKLSSRSVESTRLRIQEKIGAKNMAGIIIYAIRNGIFIP